MSHLITEADPLGGAPAPGGLGGGMPPPPGGGMGGMGGGLGGGMGGLGGGLGGGMGGMGGAQGSQEPVPVKTISAMDVWEVLKNTVSEMDKHKDLSIFHRDKVRQPRTSQAPQNKDGNLPLMT